MNQDKRLEDFLVYYKSLAKKCKEENRMVFNHFAVRVEDLDEAEKLMCESFGLDSFLRPTAGTADEDKELRDATFDQEKELRIAWFEDYKMYIEFTEFDGPQKIGYDTGVGQPIGHLSEIGFFVPSMEKALQHLSPKGWEVTSAIDVDNAKMYKVNNSRVQGIPVELIECQVED
jgi:hypothetical protein